MSSVESASLQTHDTKPALFISASEGAEDSVSKFTSLVRNRDLLSLAQVVVNDCLWTYHQQYNSGPEVIKLFSCSIQLSMKF